MHWKLLNVHPPVTYAVVLSTDDEVMTELGRFVREQNFESGSVTAIGAFRHTLLGYFDWQTKQYQEIVVDEQVEVLSLLGDVAVADKGPSLHLHTVVGKFDGSVVGGHLLEGHVRPTLEAIVTQPPSYLRKRRDPVTSLPLITVDPI